MTIANKELTIYDNARYWIAQYESVDEVKDYADKAAAVEEYARRANDMEMEVKAAKARIRAERRMGELLMNMEKAKGNQYVNSARSAEITEQIEKPKTLSEMGISKTRSSESQKLAKVPEDDFEDQLNAEGSKPSKSAIIKSSEPKSEVPKIDEDAVYLWGATHRMINQLQHRDINELFRLLPDPMKEPAKESILNLIDYLGVFKQ